MEPVAIISVLGTASFGQRAVDFQVADTVFEEESHQQCEDHQASMKHLAHRKVDFVLHNQTCVDITEVTANISAAVQRRWGSDHLLETSDFAI